MRTPTPWLAAALCWLLAQPLAAVAQELAAPPPATEAKPNTPEADKKARTLFEQGRAAFSEGRYRDAWEHFREAYILSKRPELLYNVGQSADRMRMDREALAAFKLYLERLPRAENRKEVEARIVWLEDRLKREDSQPEVNPTTLDDTSDEPTLPAGEQGEAPAQSPESLSDEPGDENDKDADDAKTADLHGQPERDAWYARAALGLGLMLDALGDSSADSLGSVTLSGLLGLGYDIRDGLVIGGGISFDWGLAPTAKQGNFSADIDTANLTLVVAFVDYYLAPRQHGWHLLGGLAVGTLALSDKSATVGIENATGGGLVLGGGCEWTLNREWAVGALAKVVLARLSTDTAQHNMLVPSVAATAAWY